MTATDLEAMLALAEAATPGPWRVGNDLEDCTVRAGNWTLFKPNAHHEQHEETTRYVAAADPSTVATLIRRLIAAEAERDRLLGVLKQIDGGDYPCTNESLLRQWAYEAVTLGKSVDELSSEVRGA